MNEGSGGGGGLPSKKLRGEVVVPELKLRPELGQNCHIIITTRPSSNKSPHHESFVACVLELKFKLLVKKVRVVQVKFISPT